ncbi:MAG TPA: tetratricopeptide repeat protein, partial [Pyrinomonadaceae bacterium]|nr:tetratricopeptide repeat protein [Pyrinomonadaceae bacterium]
MPTRAQTAAQDAPKQPPQPLKEGQYALKGGESHSYLVQLAAGQFLHALVEQQGIDVSVSLFKPDGSQISVSDSPNDRYGTEPALLIADVAGEYRVEVRAPNARANPAQYQIKIVAVREPSATDQQHVNAQRTFDEAQKLRAQSAATAKRDAIVKYQQAAPLFQAASDTYRQMLSVQATGIAHAQLSEFRTALRLFEEALALAQRMGDQRSEAPIETLLGGSYDVLGEITKSHQHYERARVLAGRLNDGPTQGSAFNNIGKLHHDAGDFQRALDYYLQALPLFADTASRRAITLNNIGVTYNSMGEPERALDYLQQSLAIL